MVYNAIDYRKKLFSLKSLRKGWDGYDAPEINLESIDRSIALLDLVNVNALAILKVEPSEEGGVNLFFEKDEYSTMGCSVGDNRMSYFIKSKGKAPVFSDFLEYSDKNLMFWKNQVNQFAEDIRRHQK